MHRTTDMVGNISKPSSKASSQSEQEMSLTQKEVC